MGCVIQCDVMRMMMMMKSMRMRMMKMRTLQCRRFGALRQALSNRPLSVSKARLF